MGVKMSYNKRKNHLTGNLLSDEWYTPKFLVDKCIEIAKDLGLTSDSQVLLPFDTDDSFFVKQLNDYEKTYNIQDFLENNYKYDFLITNPPFSLKEKVFEKCLQNQEPFILVLPQTYIFSTGFYDLLQKYGFNYRIHSPKQRVYFIDQNGNQNRPNFHTIIVSVSPLYSDNRIEHFYSEV